MQPLSNPPSCTIEEPCTQNEESFSSITALNLWNGEENENRDCRDGKCEREYSFADHIALLCQLIAHRPDIVRAVVTDDDRNA